MTKDDNTVLVIDDDESSREAIAQFLETSGYAVSCAGSFTQAMGILAQEGVKVVVTDLVMPNGDGMSVLKHVKGTDASVGVILATGYGTVENAVSAMREGADHYLIKPINLKELRITIERIIERQTLLAENLDLKKRLNDKYSIPNLIGNSIPIQDITDKINQIASSNANILLTGESGTGKGVVANIIHQNSPRHEGAFVSLNCAALSEGILESELFGHERGAFSGAVSQKKGRFELADGGTLFLDEVSEIPAAVQVKLLNVLEEREFMRVGGERQIRVDIRLIAATNKDLERLVTQNKFREDLYYRLQVVIMSIPPLRQRREDIPLLVSHFIGESSRSNNRKINGLSKEAMDMLTRYDWPGNVRELKNTVESMVILATADSLDVADIPERTLKATGEKIDFEIKSGMSLEEIEREAICKTLEDNDYVRERTAEILGISTRTLYRKIKEYSLEKEMSE